MSLTSTDRAVGRTHEGAAACDPQVDLLAELLRLFGDSLPSVQRVLDCVHAHLTAPLGLEHAQVCVDEGDGEVPVAAAGAPGSGARRVVPLQLASTTVGLLTLTGHRLPVLRADVAATIAHHLAVALGMLSLRQEQDFWGRSARAIRRLFEEGARAACAEEVAEVLARVVADAFSVERVAVAVVDEEGRYTSVAGVGLPAQVEELLAERMVGASATDSPLYRRMVRTSAPVLVDDGAGARLRAGGMVETLQLRSFVGIPLLSEAGALGVVFFGDADRNRTWSAREEELAAQLTLEAAVVMDSARLRQVEQQRLDELVHKAFHDELTGLPNRRLVLERAEQAVALGARRGTVTAVLLIDLDRFKEVNDTLGHHHGDQLLKAVAARLGGSLRASDTVARLGGDEFAVLLPEVADEAAAVELARRCIQVLEEEFTIEGVVLTVEASIGLALAPQHGTDANGLMRAADVAMYEAKSSGRGVVVYDSDLDVHTPTRLALLGDLRRALAADQLQLHYQPKVDTGTGQVKGVEALLRWQHPERGTVPPADFIPAAEGTGLIMPLTLRTLELAISQARTWMDAGHPLQVAVNLSPRCLLELGFAAQVGQLLQHHGLPPHLLRLEVTETTVMVDPARAMSILSALQELGVSLSIDDFGTGYSSMSYLKRMPVDELKIDRSFVMDMLANGSDDVLVRSSIELGHNLGLSVVAEGVEDEETRRALEALGCDVVQGYHLARPMAADALTAWLSEGPAAPVGGAARG